MSGTLIAIETATEICSVALIQEGRLTAELMLSRPRAHAENLAPLLRDALAYGGLGPSALDAVAVSGGPGSYTGLRIGVSTAKGLAAAVGAALVAVPTLEALAASAAAMAAAGDVVLATLHARRTELYAAAYEVRDDGGLAERAGASAVESAHLRAWLGETGAARLWLVGDGAARAAEALGGASAEVRLLDPTIYRPSAGWVARRGLARLKRGQTEDVAAYEPAYLKAFIAKKGASVFEKLSF